VFLQANGQCLINGKLAELSQNEAFLRASVAELNGDLLRRVEPLQKEVRRIKNRLGEIEQEIGRYIKALGQEKLSIARLELHISALEADKKTLELELFGYEQKVNESAVRDFNADLLQRTLQDFRAVFKSLTPTEQAEALQCVLKGVTVRPDSLALEIFDLGEFSPSSQNRKEWLPGEDSNFQHFG
jgi:chromosome segregation ATPase